RRLLPYAIGRSHGRPQRCFVERLDLLVCRRWRPADSARRAADRTHRAEGCSDERRPMTGFGRAEGLGRWLIDGRRPLCQARAEPADRVARTECIAEFAFLGSSAARKRAAEGGGRRVVTDDTLRSVDTAPDRSTGRRNGSNYDARSDTEPKTLP